MSKLYAGLQSEEPPTMEIATIGIDLAKHWFQVHGVDAEGRAVVRKRLRRRRSSRSSHPCRDVWWAPRPAQPPITGRAS